MSEREWCNCESAWMEMGYCLANCEAAEPALTTPPAGEEGEREKVLELAARGMCRGRIISNLIRDGRQEGSEWIQRAEDAGWEFHKWDASVAIGRLEQEGYTIAKRLSSPRVEEVRREAFEEAAKVAETWAQERWTARAKTFAAAGHEVARRIRSLSPQGG